MILHLNAELKETSLFIVLLIKIFVSSHQTQKSPCFCESLDELWLAVNGRRGQGIQSITCKIRKPKMTLKTFYIPFLFKPIKCMDTVRIVHFLYHEHMMRILCPKPSSFCGNEPPLYPRNIVGILVKLVFLRGGVFSQ